MTIQRERVLQAVHERRLVAIIRTPTADRLVELAEAFVAADLTVMEVTFTFPEAAQAIAAIRKRFGSQVVLGAGTILDPPTAQAALSAGAEFLVSPNTSADVLQFGRRYGAVCVPGALTPTEIVRAWELGADAVKVFPAQVFGPEYLKLVHGPLPQIPLLPTGGITRDNMGAYLAAGAVAVGLGNCLFPQPLFAAGDWSAITAGAHEYVTAARRPAE